MGTTESSIIHDSIHDNKESTDVVKLHSFQALTAFFIPLNDDITDDDRQNLDLIALTHVHFPQGIQRSRLEQLFYEDVSQKLFVRETCLNYGVSRMIRSCNSLLRKFRLEFIEKTHKYQELELKRLEDLSKATTIIALLIKDLTKNLNIIRLLYYLDHLPCCYKQNYLSSKKENSDSFNTQCLNNIREQKISNNRFQNESNVDAHNHKTSFLTIVYREIYKLELPADDRDDFQSFLLYQLKKWLTKIGGEEKESIAGDDINPSHLQKIYDNMRSTLHFIDKETQHVMSFEALVKSIKTKSMNVKRSTEDQFSLHVALIPSTIEIPFNEFSELSVVLEQSVLLELFYEYVVFLTSTSPLLLGASAFYIAHIHSNLLESLVRLFSITFVKQEGREPLTTSTDDFVQSSSNIHNTHSKCDFSQNSAKKPNGSIDAVFLNAFIQFINAVVQRHHKNPVLENEVNCNDSCHASSQELHASVPDYNIAEYLIKYLLTNIWIRHGQTRQSVRVHQSIPSYDNLISSSKSMPPDLFAASGLARRLFTLSLATLSIVVLHNTNNYNKSMCISSNNPQAKEKQTLNHSISSPSFSSNTLAQTFICMTDPNYFGNLDIFPLSQLEKHRQVTSLHIPISFDALLAAFSSQDVLSNALAPLVLYTLIYRNRTFRLFCLSRLDCQHYILPILGLLYETSCYSASNEDGNNNQVGLEFSEIPPCTSEKMGPLPSSALLLLLVLLILSKDPNFCASLFTSELPAVPEWFLTAQQRHKFEAQPISDDSKSHSHFTLGSLLLLIVLRLISWNFSKHSDLFAQEVCGGLLINISKYMKNLHWLVAERYVEFTRRLTRQIIKHAPSFYDTTTITDGSQQIQSLKLPFDILTEYLEREGKLCNDHTQNDNTHLAIMLNATPSTLPSGYEDITLSSDTINVSHDHESKHADLNSAFQNNGILTTYKNVLNSLCIALAPSKIFMRNDLEKSDDTHQFQDLEQTRTIINQYASTPLSAFSSSPPECSFTNTIPYNFMLLHGLLRSEGTLIALKTWKLYGDHILRSLKILQNELLCFKLYISQYRTYINLKTYSTIDNMVPLNMLLQALSPAYHPPHLTEIEDSYKIPLPYIPPPPQSNLYNSESGFLCYDILSNIVATLPCVQYLIDLSSLLLIDVDGTELIQTDDYNLAELRRVCKQVFLETDLLKSPLRKAACLRIELFEKTVMLKAPLNYTEAPDANHYYLLPLMWKVLSSYKY